jgi:hypothetical protein
VFSDAAEEIGDDQNGAKTDDCADGNDPAGFLNSAFHDFPDGRDRCSSRFQRCMALCLMKNL